MSGFGRGGGKLRVFVTGATGFIGSAVAAELIGAGHDVVGLARTDAAARALEAAGAKVHRGALDDLDSLARGAAAADGVIHTAFIHDFSNFEAACQVDKIAVQALGTALAGSNRPLVVSSGIFGLPSDRPGTEEDTPSAAIPRKSEQTALSFVSRGVRASVVRLAPSVHGDGDHAFVPRLIAVAREQGFSSFVGDGTNHWPAVHRLDAASLYRLALEQGAAGARFHGVAEEGVPIREIAAVIGRRLGVPVVSKTPAQATELLGFIGHALAMDAPASSGRTRQLLGWHPGQPGLIHDLEHGRYFEA